MKTGRAQIKLAFYQGLHCLLAKFNLHGQKCMILYIFFTDGTLKYKMDYFILVVSVCLPSLINLRRSQSSLFF